jgi:speckle-type POZ protein
MSFAGVSLVGDDRAIGHSIDVATPSGYHLLVVNGYSRTKEAAPNGTMISSLPFMIGGHCWCIRYYPNGYSSRCADYVSLFLVLVDKNISTALKVHKRFSFVDELEKQDSVHIRAKKPRNYSSTDSPWGHKKFMKRDELEKSKHLKNDCFTIRCDLTVATIVDMFIKVPPSSIQQHIYE